MSYLAIVAIIIVVVLLLVFVYNLYFNSGLRSPCIDLTGLPASMVTDANCLTKYSHNVIPGVYRSTNEGYYLCVYTETYKSVLYYYGVLVNATSEFSAIAKVVSSVNGAPSFTYDGYVCFNPDGNTTVSAATLEMLKPISSIVAGTNVVSTVNLPTASAGPTAAGPKSATSSLITF
jgi:hypothetical protein